MEIETPLIIAEAGERKTVDTRPMLTKPNLIEKVLRPKFSELCLEEFHALTLDAKMREIGTYLISRGTAMCAMIEPREVFRRAILDCACFVVVAHNHPSGDVAPSESDIKSTEKLIAAGKVVGIELIDHLILGTSPCVKSNGYASLAYLGYIDAKTN